jgi:glutamine synthetase
MLTPDELAAAVAADEIDTVVVAFPDMQGRLMGKRVRAAFFLEELPRNSGSVEACDYLLAVDVDMNVLEGFRFANWETGYGDFECRPDMSTLRHIPWLEKTALVLCDLFDQDGAPVEVSPRRILQRQIQRAADAGFVVKCGTELEFFLYDDSYRAASDGGYRDLRSASTYILDYHVLETSKHEGFLRTARNQMAEAGVPIEYSKGEAGVGQHELNLRYAEALTCADNHTVYKNGLKELAASQDRAVTFMAKPAIDDGGNSCHVHSSIWSSTTDESLVEGSGPGHLSEGYSHWLAGLLGTAAEFAMCFAPFVNSYKRYQDGSWAPTALGWGLDNRTLAFRVVGHGAGRRAESRIPGADCNPYIALAATIAGGLHGIETSATLDPPFEGNGYESDLPRIPTSLVDAIDAFESSDVATAAFGEDVQFHLAHMARAEWTAFNNTVTDWELRRGFEQL